MSHSKDPFRISDLLLKKLNDSLTYSEEVELSEWLALSDENRDLLKKLSNGKIRLRDVHKLTAFDTDKALKEVTSRIYTERKYKTAWKRSYFPTIAAAAVLILVSIALWLYTGAGRRATPPTQPRIAKTDIPPGSNKAFLVLANGARIDLEDTKSGRIADQAGVTVQKTANGALAYDGLTPNAGQDAGRQPSGLNAQIAYNTLAVPRGGQFQLTLSDGSKVWLNAASSLKYPVVFNSAERIVELSGEAYFEIAQNVEKPFKVVTRGQVVEVLGTHFDIESYPDEENQTTTLLQGSVRVTSSSSSSILKPGQKVIDRENSGRLMTAEANVEEAIAWKEGNFMFNDEQIQSMMKKLSRWYDVDVVYSSTISHERFWGTYARAKSLNSLLKSLEETHAIHFKIEGRKIIVGP